VGNLPGYGSPHPVRDKITFVRGVSEDGNREFAPSLVQSLEDSVHHQVIAFEFTKQQQGTAAIPNSSREVVLLIRGLEEPGDRKAMTYPLPLKFSTEAADALFPTLGPLSVSALGPVLTFFPLVAGLLVYFSPCFMEMTAVYLALISGVRVSELSEKKSNRGFRLRIVASALLFVAGFASIYTAAGIVAGYSGQIMQGSIFENLSFPFRIIGGSVLIYLGMQSSGYVPRVLGLHSSPLFPKVNASCRVGGSFAVGLTFGCLQCFRGSLVVAMLFFAWTMGSAGSGGLIMLLLALTFGIPFVLIAVLAGRASFVERLAPRIAGYAGLATSVFLILLGVSTLLFDNHPLLDPLYYAFKAMLGPNVPVAPP
ncbi:MAG: sulfite exporter TauE/SafE family protein, partial [Thaumarchaeota archaeon]|nr:sulfite exporter TauE/SafE family protein [Nitrososphaerota archaeon]